MKDVQNTSLVDKMNQFINKNSTAVLGLLVIIAVGFGAYSVLSSYNQKYEEKAQTVFFEAERLHNANQGAKEFTKENSKADAPPVNVDTAQVEQKLNSLIEEFPKSKASIQAALLMSDIYLDKKDSAKALETLEKSFSKFNGRLLDSLLGLKLSGLYEQNNQCDKALPVLEKVYNSKVEELRPEALLRQALCEEVLGQADKAKQTYQKLATEHSDTNQGQQAQKYLKIM